VADPNLTVLDSVGIFSALSSHAMKSGLFESVNGHETVSAPGNGLHYETWYNRISPVRGGSGLNLTSALVIFNGRIKCDAMREPRDGVETDVLTATDRLLLAYSGQFQLALSNVRAIDLLGLSGVQLEARGGYLKMDTRDYRVSEITIPIIVSDVWEQLA
jgi:hypothetical protein